MPERNGENANTTFIYLLFFVLLMTASGLWGCASTKTLTVKGTVATPENRSFSLSSKGQDFIVTPGNMSIELMEHVHNFIVFAYPCSSLLQIWNDQGKVVTEYPPEWKLRLLYFYMGKLTGNQLSIPGVKQGLSCDLNIFWEDQSESIYDIQGVQSCQYLSWCWVTSTETVCDNDGKNCRDKKVSKRDSCWETGSEDVIITKEKYKRAYAMDFVNPVNGTESYGHFSGLSDILERELKRESISPCR